MKQSNDKKHYREDTAALLVRISRDDGEEGESNSIQNQKMLLTKVAKEKGYTDLLVFSDDGVTGTTMKRPGFQAMIKAIEQGSIGAVFVKDLSRLGRNYREVGYYTEEFFPEHDVRFVAVSDGIDTAEGEDDFAPFRNIMNEWYARDAKKRRIVNKLKGSAGEPLSPPPYGYIKDPENPKRWIVDEEPAAVVRKIYDMTLGGFGIAEVARALDEAGIVTPTFYWRSKGINRGGLKSGDHPTLWRHSTIYKVLAAQEYCGDVINFKTFSKSYKNKKRIKNTDENQIVFLGVHEAVIDRATWEKVQQMRGTRKKRPKNGQERSIFSGLLKCADCGKNLGYHFNQGNHDIKYFNCSNYNSGRGDCNATHYIRLDFIEQVVLQEFHRLTEFANRYEDDFVKAIIGHSMKAAETDRALKQKELDALIARDKELDRLFERIYEDNVAGKISDERFAKMSKGYEQEQGEITGRLKILKTELKKEKGQRYTAEMFLEIVRRYTNAQELTQRMVTELIDHIDVYHAQRVDGVVTQRVKVFYYCIGAFDVPDWDAIPGLDILIETRKGVELFYTPSEKAV